MILGSRLFRLFGADLVADAGEAAAAGQVELPAVQLAGQGVAVDDAEAAEVGLEVRATALHGPLAELGVLGVDRLLVLVVPALGVLQALLAEALEERVDELVVLPDAGRGEAAGQEQRVDPVTLVDVDEVLDQSPAGLEAVAHLLVGVGADLLAGEVHHDRLDDGAGRAVGVGEVEADRAADALGHVDRLFEQRLDALLELAENVDLGVPPGGLLG